MTPATQLFDALSAARESNAGILSRAQWIAAADRFLAEHCIVLRKKLRRAKKDRPHNPLFDALALGTGCRDISKITRHGGACVGDALAQIREVSPDLTAAEIERVTEAYKQRHPTWPCTPGSIAKHWAEFVACSPTNGAKRDIYIEPMLWSGTAVELFGEDIGGQMKDRGWRELDPATRAQILSRLK